MLVSAPPFCRAQSRGGLVVINDALTRVQVFLRVENRVRLVARSNGQFLVRWENRKKLVKWSHAISCRCLTDSSGLSHRLSMVCEAGAILLVKFYRVA